MKKFGTATLFMGGLILMGSDSGWFPWVNIAGIVMFIAFGVTVTRLAKTDWKEIDRNHLEKKKG